MGSFLENKIKKLCVLFCLFFFFCPRALLTFLGFVLLMIVN